MMEEKQQQSNQRNSEIEVVNTEEEIKFTKKEFEALLVLGLGGYVLYFGIKLYNLTHKNTHLGLIIIMVCAMLFMLYQIYKKEKKNDGNNN